MHLFARAFGGLPVPKKTMKMKFSFIASLGQGLRFVERNRGSQIQFVLADGGCQQHVEHRLRTVCIQEFDVARFDSACSSEICHCVHAAFRDFRAINASRGWNKKRKLSK